MSLAVAAISSHETRRTEGIERTTSGGDSTASEGAERREGTQGSSAPLAAPLVSPLVERTPLIDFFGCEPKLEAHFGADESGWFPSPIRGREGRARLDQEDGEICVRWEDGRWRSLGWARAAQAYERDRNLDRPELAVWTRLLAFEHGIFSPLDVPVPLAPDLSASALRLRDGFKLLIGLRWRDGATVPISYSARFAAAWCSTSPATANRATTELREREVIYIADTQPPKPGRRFGTPLYLPVGVLAAEMEGER